MVQLDGRTVEEIDAAGPAQYVRSAARWLSVAPADIRVIPITENTKSTQRRQQIAWLMFAEGASTTALKLLPCSTQQLSAQPAAGHYGQASLLYKTSTRDPSRTSGLQKDPRSHHTQGQLAHDEPPPPEELRRAIDIGLL